MTTAVLQRTNYGTKETLGQLTVFEHGKPIFTCATLELPWLNNAKRISCIPSGDYEITPRNSQKYGLHYAVNNVPGRDAILIHSGNYFTDILGCILVGSTHLDINGDGLKDVANSKATLKKILAAAPKGFNLKIN